MCCDRPDPPWAALLQVALASAAGVLAGLQPAPEDPKKAKKEAAKPKKGATAQLEEEVDKDKVDPAVRWRGGGRKRGGEGRGATHRQGKGRKGI